ncbi:MAG: lamin tail domain-containing protein [Spirochaetales bacterium]|nr:lamin tail domain-containing protein [Leptospiraceae bacterium]MCP5482388.1 lamin tail domain-containing protein [Spirochaetales bacterium]MCP5484173.1 lamin tail domain-containing protein [Spirochaetales bacterium]
MSSRVNKMRGKSQQRFGGAGLLWLVPAMVAAALSCTTHDGEDIFGDPRFWGLGPNRLSVYYSDPGISEETSVDKKVDRKLIELIDEAEISVDMAVYNLGRESIIEAMIRAEDRGIRVRMVGDVDEVVTNGYRAILRTRIPFSLGNSIAIQHNKFAVIDGRYVFMGTGNITDSGFRRNNNNYMIVESPELANHYTQEFEQMYYGRYGSKKVPFTTNHNFIVNFTPLEVYYSPYGGQDAMDRMIELVNGARTEIRYMIFAHTHDELTSALIRAARRGVLVRGVHDKTFVRGTSEEAPRIYSASRYLGGSLQTAQDGNEFTAVQGVAAHGGKLHTKTLIIDGAVVCTGSFNWSTNAIENNDENMVVVHSPLVAQELMRQWDAIWAVSQPVTRQITTNAGETANPGEVVISEIMWAGSYEGTSYESGDDWVELYNRSGRDIDVSHWVLTWDQAETVHYPIPDRFNWYEPGVASRHYSSGRLVIPAGRYFLLKAINNGAIAQEDNKISGTKDFGINDSSIRLRLYDNTMTLIDEAGNGDPPVAGRLDSFNQIAYSMERFFYPAGHAQEGQALPGASPGSWYTSNGNNQTGTALSGLGQLETTFRACTFGAGQRCTVGTPNYSGNGSSIVNPSTPTGGSNALTNIPLSARSTSATSVRVQMRWAMQAAPAVAGGSCPCTASVSASDPSIITVTTGAQTAGTLYTLSIGSALDITTGNSVAGNISYTGHGNANADLRIMRVYPQQSSSEDLVVLQALTGGTLDNLGIYYFDFSSPTPILIYRLTDAEILTGDYVEVKLDSACQLPCGIATVTPEDRRLGNSPSMSITANPNGGTTTGGFVANNSWQVFSAVPGMSSTDGIIMISYDLSQPPLDVMCYSNRDGDMSIGLMQGGMRTLYRYGSSVYNLGSELPVDSANDSIIQAHCSLFVNGSNGSYLGRSVDTNNGSDFTQF